MISSLRLSSADAEECWATAAAAVEVPRGTEEEEDLLVHHHLEATCDCKKKRDKKKKMMITMSGCCQIDIELQTAWHTAAACSRSR